MFRLSIIHCSFLAALLIAATATTAIACLWDYDTLQMERQRFPGVLEIITGKFVRHSRVYYEWRIKDRTKKLEAGPGDPALIDDLAVAHDKLGQPQKGIALLEKSLQQHPDRYETLANLGTLMFHAGKIEESKQYIEKAIEINPDAHFGRERYQLLLTEYLLQSEHESSGVMCSEQRNPTLYEPIGFAKYVLAAKFGDRDPLNQQGGWQDVAADTRNRELREAGKGVLGMMHFANYQSPVLLEALGDLLMTGEVEENGTHLASRAYLRAAAGSTDDVAAGKYRTMAEQVLANLTQYQSDDPEAIADLPKLERQLNEEIADATAYVAAIEANERKWITAGENVDDEFAAMYYDSLDDTIAQAKRASWWQWVRENAVSIAIPALVVVPVIAGLMFWIRRRRRIAITPDPVSKGF